MGSDWEVVDYVSALLGVVAALYVAFMVYGVWVIFGKGGK